MKLTGHDIEQAGAATRPYKMWDGCGLHLHVAPTGTKSWRMKYRIGGKEQLRTLGQYPHVSLEQARMIANEARFELRLGVGNASQLASQIGSLPALHHERLNLLKGLRPINGTVIYFVLAPVSDAIKIGLTANVKSRLQDLQVGHAEQLALLATLPGSALHESYLHFIFADEHIRGEWFRPSDRLMAYIGGIKWH